MRQLRKLSSVYAQVTVRCGELSGLFDPQTNLVQCSCRECSKLGPNESWVQGQAFKLHSGLTGHNSWDDTVKVAQDQLEGTYSCYSVCKARAACLSLFKASSLGLGALADAMAACGVDRRHGCKWFCEKVSGRVNLLA